MKPLRARIEQERKRTNAPWEVLERDYLLSWILQGIYGSERLSKSLVFKGGTALKKCYFGNDYRFSEDLDFSSYKEVPRGNELFEELKSVCSKIEENIYDFAPVSLDITRYEEKEPHPSGQEAFIIRAKFPWHRDFQTPTIIEITVDEEIIISPLLKTIIHPYGELMTNKVQVYSLEEIIAEKLRALLQQTERLKMRGWGRSRVRDFYDLWRIQTEFNHEINWKKVPEILKEKCKVRNVSFTSADDFFNDILISNIVSQWKQWLLPLVSDLSDFEIILKDLKILVKRLLG